VQLQEDDQLITNLYFSKGEKTHYIFYHNQGERRLKAAIPRTIIAITKNLATADLLLTKKNVFFYILGFQGIDFMIACLLACWFPRHRHMCLVLLPT
jgi:hypothetical protein